MVPTFIIFLSILCTIHSATTLLGGVALDPLTCALVMLLIVVVAIIIVAVVVVTPTTVMLLLLLLLLLLRMNVPTIIRVPIVLW